MSTRATYTFSDEFGDYSVYKHQDGGPEYALQWIARADCVTHGFEADHFGIYFIVANQDQGSMRLSEGREAHGDTEFHYDVTEKDHQIYVTIHNLRAKTVESGYLNDLLDKYAPARHYLLSFRLRNLANHSTV